MVRSVNDNLKKLSIILGHTFVAWGLCGAVIAIGREVATLKTALIIHAISVPIIFAIVSAIYFTKFNYTTVLQTAIVFLSFVVLMDFFVVALLIEQSFQMFASVLGTWIPFVLIFVSTYLTGLYATKQA